MEYELKTVHREGKVIHQEIARWEGKDGLTAANRCMDAHPGIVVVAWRTVPHGLFIGGDPRQVIG